MSRDRVERYQLGDIAISKAMSQYAGPRVARGGEKNFSTDSEKIVSFPHKCIIIKIKDERIEQTGSVYDAVRWRPKASIGRARMAEYVLAVVKGHVVGVFKPTLWYHATYENAMKYGGVAYETDLVYHEKIRDELLQNQVGGRIGFEGVEAELEVSDLYLGKRVPQPHWSTQNPVSYTYENDGRAKSYVHSAADSQKPRYAPAQIPASDASDDIDDLTEGMQKRIDSISDDIDDLAEGMQKLIDSIKEYE